MTFGIFSIFSCVAFPPGQQKLHQPRFFFRGRGKALFPRHNRGGIQGRNVMSQHSGVAMRDDLSDTSPFQTDIEAIGALGFAFLPASQGMHRERTMAAWDVNWFASPTTVRPQKTRIPTCRRRIPACSAARRENILKWPPMGASSIAEIVNTRREIFRCRALGGVDVGPRPPG